MNIRPMSGADVEGVVALLSAALGAGPGGADRRDLFEWKHIDNPFGRSIALVAEEEGRIVGLRAFMRWRFAGESGNEISAVRAVDTATDAAVRRRGVFSSLTSAALEAGKREGVGFVFNTPNEASLPGYLQMGWVRVAKWPVWVRARRRLRVLSAAARRDLAPGLPFDPPRGSPLTSATDALALPGIESLVASAAAPNARLYTPRSMDYLRWRYARSPLPYYALAAGDPPVALAVIRLRWRGRLKEAVVCDVLAAQDAGRVQTELLRDAPAAADADHAVLRPDGSLGGGGPRAGYRRVPVAGITFTVRPISAIGVDPLDPENWALSLGDLEVF